MAGDKQDLINNIDSLKSQVKLHYPDMAAGVKVLENIGDHAFVIKFAVFSNLNDLNLTIQIPSICY